MPGGIQNPQVGYVAFCAVKFAGYSVAAHWMSLYFKANDRNLFVVGGIRTLIGMGAGAMYYGAMRCFVENPLSTGSGFILGLAPIRIIEWTLLIWLFYKRNRLDERKTFGVVIAATVWSYVLDIPAIIGFIFSAGVWIC